MSSREWPDEWERIADEEITGPPSHLREPDEADTYRVPPENTVNEIGRVSDPGRDPQPRRDQEPRRYREPRRYPLSDRSLLGSSLLGSDLGERLRDENTRAVTLRELDGEDAIATALRDALDIAAPLGGRFTCVLPGHEQEAHANFWRDDRGTWVYRDYSATSQRAAFTLSEVYAAAAAGRVLVLDGPRLVLWHVRLLADLGVIGLPAVDLPPLEGARAGSVADLLWEGIQLLFQVRAAAGFRTETPLTREFLGAWCGVADGGVYTARCRLRDAEVIQRAGEQGRMHLWRPCAPEGRVREPDTAHRPAASRLTALLVGDEGYHRRIADALAAELMTEDEAHVALRAHDLVLIYMRRNDAERTP